jgi:hypothetical protein
MYQNVRFHKRGLSTSCFCERFGTRLRKEPGSGHHEQVGTPCRKKQGRPDNGHIPEKEAKVLLGGDSESSIARVGIGTGSCARHTNGVITSKGLFAGYQPLVIPRACRPYSRPRRDRLY